MRVEYYDAGVRFEEVVLAGLGEGGLGVLA